MLNKSDPSALPVPFRDAWHGLVNYQLICILAHGISIHLNSFRILDSHIPSAEKKKPLLEGLVSRGLSTVSSHSPVSLCPTLVLSSYYVSKMKVGSRCLQWAVVGSSSCFSLYSVSGFRGLCSWLRHHSKSFVAVSPEAPSVIVACTYDQLRQFQSSGQGQHLTQSDPCTGLVAAPFPDSSSPKA